MKKFIFTILILGLVLPGIAKAGDWVGGPFQILQTVKDSVLDPLSTFAKNPLAKVIFYEIDRLMRGEFSDANQPNVILNWGNYLDKAANRGSMMFIAEFDKAFGINDKFESGMKAYLQTLGFADQLINLPTYSQYAKPTLKEDLGPRYGPCVESGYSVKKCGWTGYYSMAKPQNSIYGQAMMADMARRDYEESQKEAAALEGQAGSGFQNRQECIRYATEKVPDDDAQELCFDEHSDCKDGCFVNPSAMGPFTTISECYEGACDPGLANCLGFATREETTGICEEYRVQNVGSELHRLAEKTLDFDLDKLISADELEDLFTMLMTAILGQKTQGPGWGTTMTSAEPQSWSYKPYKQTMSYYQLQRSAPSLGEREKARTEMINLVYDAVGRMSRSVASCRAEEKRKQRGQMPQNQEKALTRLENQLLDLLEAYVPELYIRETGIPLQPDFELLDPGNAPFKVYGQTWEEVPFKYYTSECAMFGKKCGEFDSKLPTSKDLSLDCKACIDAINKNIQQCKTDCGYDKNCLQGCNGDTAKTKAIADKKCPPEEIEIPPFQPGGPGGGEPGGGGPKEEKEPYMMQKEENQFFGEFSILAQIVDDAAFANTCNEQLNVVQLTKNACGDCIEAVEFQCENLGTEEKKAACIEQYCNNFAGVVENETLFESIARTFPELPVVEPSGEEKVPEVCKPRMDRPSPWEPCCGEGLICEPSVTAGLGQEFYDRCEIQEKKDTCFACLKQYFMPANYPMEIRDYIGRGFIVHPYLLVETFYSRADKSIGSVITGVVKAILSPITGFLKLLFGSSTPDIEEYYEYHLNYCIGTCPEIMHSESQCPNHSKNEGVPVGLICRAFPDDPKCRTCDNLTTNILDFKPDDRDCGNKVQKGALNPLTLINNASFRHRSKYCRALVGHDTGQYTKCSKAQSTRPDTPEECRINCASDYDNCIEAGIVEDTCLGLKTLCDNECDLMEEEQGQDQCLADCIKNCAPDDDICESDCEEDCFGEPVAACGDGVIESPEECDDGMHCDNGTACTTHAECAGIGDELCLPRNGDGCSVDCELEAVPGECTGTATICDDFDSFDCEDQDGCSWYEDYDDEETGELVDEWCDGVATECSTFSFPVDCDAQDGCTWQ